MNQTSNAVALQALAKAIRKARENADLKQDVAAKLLHITRGTLSGYENEKTKDITVNDLLNMSRLYNRPVASFFEPPSAETPVKQDTLLVY